MDRVVARSDRLKMDEQTDVADAQMDRQRLNVG